MFEFIALAPADPILGLLDIFQNDIRPNKINLGIGVYQDDNSNTPVLTSVKEAEKIILENENSKNYLAIDGIPAFAEATQLLLFGTDSNIITNNRSRCAQTPGGTGALRVAADFIIKNTNIRRVWISDPSWPNHKNIFNAAGFEVYNYSYHSNDSYVLNLSKMINDLNHAQSGDVVVFHACCHNPTGMDPTEEQWHELAALSKRRGWLPLFDLAYQGFANDLETDAIGLRIFCQTNKECIICNSYSKNFAIYNERVGACTLVASDRDCVNRAFSQLKSVIRANYSNPPAHGAIIVTTILSNKKLRITWEKELCEMRNRIKFIRQLFVNTLLNEGAPQYYNFINKQNGMFSFSGLNINQVLKLRNQSAIYLVDSGRINISGISKNNIKFLCKAIVSVLNNT